MKRISLLTHSILLGLVSLGLQAQEIAIEQSNSNAKIPVILEGGQGFHPAATKALLDSVNLFDIYVARCGDKVGPQNQEAVCVRSQGRSEVNPDYMRLSVDMPGVGTLTANRSPHDARGIASVIYSSTVNLDVENFSFARAPFDSQLLLVLKHRESGEYRLVRTEFDGSDLQVLHTSKMPILSPTWSPDGKYVSYVSYEGYRSAVYLYQLSSGLSRKVYGARGLNAYPSFKDNSTLLLSVSNERKGSDLVEFDLLKNRLTYLTHSESRSDIYPVAESEGVAFVRMFDDIPYLFYRGEDKRVRQVSRTPANTPSADKDGRVATAYGNQVRIWNIEDTKVVHDFKVPRAPESLSMTDNGSSLYFVSGRNNHYALEAYTDFGHRMFSWKTKHYDVIQVSAK